MSMKGCSLMGLALATVFLGRAEASPLWIEGEQAKDKTLVANAGLDAVDPEELSGGAWISSFANGEQPTGTAEYDVTLSAAGSYRLWVRGTGGLSYRIGQGVWLAVDPKLAKDLLRIAADGNPGYPTIGWFDLGTISLEAGTHRFSWLLGAETGNARYGAIDCFVLADDTFVPNGACKPGESPTLIPAFAPGETWDFIPPQDAFDPAALLDLRDLNEKTAGEHGFVKLSPEGESFLRGDGQPLRFWATGLRTSFTDAKMPRMQREARFLAKRGVNLVRVFAMLPPDKSDSAFTAVNERELDAVFRLVAAFKEVGIYTMIDGYWATHTPRQPGWEAMDSGKKDLGSLVYYDPKTQAAYRAWMRALLDRPNPYTGIRLADEPAVAILQLQNEDNLLWWDFMNIKGEALLALRRHYAEFLKGKYGSLEKALAAWQNYGAEFPADDLAVGLPGFLHIWDLTRDGMAKKHGLPGFIVRSADQLEFVARLMRRFNTETIAFLRNDLGCKQLVNANNWQTVDLSTTLDAQYWADSVGEVMALNRYSGGRHYGINNGWQILSGHIYEDKSLLKFPRELPGNARQLVGRPYVLPEALWTPPNLYQAESALVVAGQQALTGLGAACWFSNFPDEMNAGGDAKWTYSTPMQLGQFPAAALIVRQALLKRGAPVVVEHRSLKNIWERTPPMLSEDSGWDPNRHAGIVHPNQPAVTTVDPLAYLVGPVRLMLDSDPAKSTVADLKSYIDHERQQVRSITGESEIDYRTGVYRFNAPQAQGAVGFLGADGPQKLADVMIECQNAYAAVAVVALDGRPLRESGKVLVQIGTVARPTGWTTRSARIRQGDAWVSCQRIVSLGAKPLQVQRIDGTLTLANAGLNQALALDPNGMPVDLPVELRQADGKAALTLPAGVLYVLLQAANENAGKDGAP
jgi:hypothetical protein